MPQMGIQPENRVKRRHRGNQSFQWLAWPLLSRKVFYTFLIIHRDQWVIQNYAALAAQTFIKTRLFSLHNKLSTQVLGDLHHLLVKGPINILWPFSDKGLSTIRLVCVDLPKVWCHPQKTLNKVTFLHSKDTRGVQWYITKEKQLTQKSSVANIKTTIYLIPYFVYID